MKDVTTMPGRLAAFLNRNEPDRTATVEQYEIMTGGYSRVMAKAAVRWSDGARETLVLRGDPAPGEAMLETDRDVEWDVLRALVADRTVTTPAARYYDRVGRDLGTKCIVLDCAPGWSLCSVLRDDGHEQHHKTAEYRDRLVDTLATVHSIHIDRVPSAVERPSDWSSYLDRTNALWADVEQRLSESNPTMRYVRAWLDANRPPPMDLVLCHGDFQASNILVAPDGTFHLVDWEYAHVGDPREDLGWYVVYSKSSPPSLYDADPEAFLARYRERTGADERHVNQATVGYFAVVSTIKVFAGILDALNAMYEGRAGSVMTTYNINAVGIGHMNFLHACAGLAEPIAALRETVSATVEGQS